MHDKFTNYQSTCFELHFHSLSPFFMRAVSFNKCSRNPFSRFLIPYQFYRLWGNIIQLGVILQIKPHRQIILLRLYVAVELCYWFCTNFRTLIYFLINFKKFEQGSTIHKVWKHYLK